MTYFLPRTNIPKTAVIPIEAKKPRIKAGPKQPTINPIMNGSNDNLKAIQSLVQLISEGIIVTPHIWLL